MQSEMFPELDAATYVGCTVHFLRQQRYNPQRCKTKPIPYVKVGRLVRYRRQDLDRWIEANMHYGPESDGGEGRDEE